MRRWIGLGMAFLIIGALNVPGRGGESSQGRKVTVPNKVPLAAIPFEATEVRLLDGPFREALEKERAVYSEFGCGSAASQFQGKCRVVVFGSALWRVGGSGR
jgi:hypothetical protein